MNSIIEKIINTELFIAITNLIPILCTILVSLIVVKIIMKIVQKGIKKSKLEKGLHTFVLKTVKIILYFIVVMIVADMVGIPISSLLATFSIVGVAASLAIQDTLSNIASGITILATNPFKAGNYVDAGGIAGTVKEINFTHTVLQTPDNKIIHVPNKQMVNSTVTNYSQMPKRRVDITFNLAYNANSDRIKEIMLNAINNHNLILKNEDIFVKATAYAASGIDYTLRVWTKSEDYWTVYFDLLEGLKKDFDNEGIEIPYNQLDVHVHKV